MSERKRALERYRRRAKAKIKRLYWSYEFYTTDKHELRPLRWPRWVKMYNGFDRVPLYDWSQYAILDSDYSRPRILLAPKWMKFLIIFMGIGQMYKGSIHGLGNYLSSIGVLDCDQGCYPSIRWLIDGRKRSKKKASQ